MLGISNTAFLPVSFGSIAKKVNVVNREVEVPDFATEDGKIARALNLQAVYNIKTYEDFIPKTIYECDREIVESDEIEDNAKWVPWVNPKDGKMYTVIKTADNEDGTKTVRVLDEDGELVKECDIRPKKIIVLDDASFFDKHIEGAAYNNDELNNHGFLVSLMAKRNNPLADVEILGGDNLLNGDMERSEVIKRLRIVLERLNNGEQIDAINISLDSEIPVAQMLEYYDIDINKLPKECVKDFIQLNFMHMQESLEEIELINKIAAKGTRIMVASGNNGRDYYTFRSGYNNVELVGGIASDGKIASDSASRKLTSHYEQFDHPVTLKKNGINVTGCHGVDFSYPEYIKKYMGKKAEGNVISGDEEKALFSAGIPERFDYEQKLIDKSNDGFLLFFEKEKTEANGGVPVYLPFDTGIGLKSSFRYLTVDKNGYLVPYLKKEISGTSYASPTRAAKVMLNDTMQEILNG